MAVGQTDELQSTLGLTLHRHEEDGLVTFQISSNSSLDPYGRIFSGYQFTLNYDPLALNPIKPTGSSTYLNLNENLWGMEGVGDGSISAIGVSLAGQANLYLDRAALNIGQSSTVEISYTIPELNNAEFSLAYPTDTGNIGPVDIIDNATSPDQLAFAYRFW